MTDLLSSQLLAELQSSTPSVFPLFRLTLPDGVRRYAAGPENVIGDGHYSGRIPQGGWPQINIGVSYRDNSLQFGSYTIKVTDADQSIADAHESAGANGIRGSATTILLASRKVLSQYWFTLNQGVVDGTALEDPATMTWAFSLHANDLPLRGQIPKVPLGPTDHPNIAPENRGLFVPIIYGVHNSQSLGSGFVPCYLVDAVNADYLVQLGWSKSVDRVYKDGVLQTSGYTITHPLVNGVRYTYIHFTGGSQGSSAITADVQGFESVGDGTGALLTGANAIAHFLANFVYKNWRSGAYYNNSVTPLNATDLATLQTYLVAMGQDSVSGWFGGSGQVTAIDVINSFCKSLDLFPYFNWDGTLSILPSDTRLTDIYQDDPRWLREGRDIESLKFRYDPSSLVGAIRVKSLFSAIASQYFVTTNVEDINISEPTTVSIEAPWQKSSLV